MDETPEVKSYFVESNLSPTGLGEPGLPPAGGAVANAIFKATGQRLLKQPFINQLEMSRSKLLG
jgi:isoquinoline 1-oxidoreductase beta subunit